MVKKAVFETCMMYEENPQDFMENERHQHGYMRYRADELQKTIEDIKQRLEHEQGN